MEAAHYELRCLMKGSQTKPAGHETAWPEVEAAPNTPQGGIPTGVPLVEVVGASHVVIIQQGTSYL